MSQKKVYFAHCMADYGNGRERKAIRIIRKHLPKWQIVNPNTKRIAAQFERERDPNDPMRFWRRQVRECDALVYLANLDGTVGAGVAVEILEALVWGKPVWRIEVTSSGMWGHFFDHTSVRMPSRVLSIEQTRDLIAKAA
jgi:hypothetical protein